MFTNPEKNLKNFGISGGMTVADLGAGSGFYTLPAAKMAEGGTVYAVEIQKDFLDTIRAKAKDAHLDNVHALWGNIEKIGGTKLSDKSADRVICSNVLFQIEDRLGFIEEIKRILKPEGKVLLVCHDPETSHLGLKSAVPKEKARKMFEDNGFRLEKEIDAGSHHYGMIMSRKR